MKIDLVSEHASPLAALGGVDAGGQNAHVAELATGLARRGHDVVVCTRRDDASLPHRVGTAAGFVVEHVTAGPAEPVPKDDLLPHMGEFGDRLAERWAADRPDLVHAHFWMSGLAAQRGAAGAGVPVLQTFHALGRVKRRHQGDKDTSPPQRIELEADIALGADKVVATCSDEVAELAEMGLPAERTAVVPCGIDLERFRPGPGGGPPNTHPKILCIGRLVERKGIDIVIRALRRIPGAELLIAGGPPGPRWHRDPEVRRLQEVAERAGVADRTTFLGQVDHERTPQLYRSVDVVVSTPWYEPFGTVPVEAMACGTPPVVSAVGGHLDTVVDGHNGVHVPPHSPAAVAQAVREVLARPRWRAELGAAGVAWARAHYGWNKLVRETEAVYRQVLAAPVVLGGGAT
ncbi:Glycosyltransferase involved in cell wall bisynthesis [Saccharopolyspora antimicrobica]|uniref:Glycosyltransferase involved in cell wall biosynthesis n=1 Tax=Saccharopolyspora antimicrobica TaxID=455193 RepID=A0A1I5KWA7_9PSEU|nr:glycosyltransferase [Saccharopolyspora antimicrobica]RKT89107.1 glycosyltransferase involved in cell wall biosynthesis [Saccharopolyspora antimicrobica]SFO89172.1 Glycosyltransferase involved in cell wall bisynthesis [Saccharopolyspora antimicrobica]